MSVSRLILFATVTAASWSLTSQTGSFDRPGPADAALVKAAISANSMRGHLSFLASDLLEGRATPSRGLDLAAEYIAAQYRRAGLEPVGDDGYFQTTTFGPENAKVRNVVGLLRGSDPKLKDTYVIVSAHYDHVGMKPDAEGDKIFNGANDDGSGTVCVIEMASAFAALPKAPARSILFIAFYGEERGLVGSRFYGRNPVVPLAKTVAMVNLEHMGRTDDRDGPNIDRVGVTGFDYTDLPVALAEIGKAEGIEVFKHPVNSDAFFRRSDNQALADVGIPAHTFSTSYIFADYHGLGDHWEKIDYDNMTRVLRALSLGVLSLANSKREPRWDASNPKAARFLAAWQKLREAAASGG